MADGINIGNEDTDAFLVRYTDGTERTIACQSAWLAEPFVCFLRVNENRTVDTIVLAINTATIHTIAPLYRSGSRDAVRAAEGRLTTRNSE